MTSKCSMTRGEAALRELREVGRMTRRQWIEATCLAAKANRESVEREVRKTKRHVFPLIKEATE